VLDPGEQGLELSATPPGQEKRLGPADRGVANAPGPFNRNGRQEADSDGVPDVERAGERAGQEDAGHLLGRHAEPAHQDPLAGGVAALA